MNCWLVETGILRKTDRVEDGVGAAEACLRPASLTAVPAGRREGGEDGWGLRVILASSFVCRGGRPACLTAIGLL